MCYALRCRAPQHRHRDARALSPRLRASPHLGGALGRVGLLPGSAIMPQPRITLAETGAQICVNL
jgi:hypothetical protein